MGPYFRANLVTIANCAVVELSCTEAPERPTETMSNNRLHLLLTDRARHRTSILDFFFVLVE